MGWTSNLILLDLFFLGFHHWAFTLWAESDHLSTVYPPTFQKSKCKQCNEIYEKAYASITIIHEKADKMQIIKKDSNLRGKTKKVSYLIFGVQPERCNFIAI